MPDNFRIAPRTTPSLPPAPADNTSGPAQGSTGSAGPQTLSSTSQSTSQQILPQQATSDGIDKPVHRSQPQSIAPAGMSGLQQAISPTHQPKPQNTVSSKPQENMLLSGTSPFASPREVFSSVFNGEHNWQHTVSASVNNDNATTILDGKYRSDDGPTSAMSFRYDLVDGDSEAHFLLDHRMLTERGWGIGTKRTDLVELSLTAGQTKDTGGSIFDHVRNQYTAGVMLNGDYGGANLQDSWHRAMEGTSLTGRYLDGSQWGVPLQNEYTGGGASLLLGYDFEGQRDLGGSAQFFMGSRGRLAAGNAGVNKLSAFTGVRVGKEDGLFLSYELQVGLQSTNGNTMNFDGAPIDGFVGQHSVSAGLALGGFQFGVDFKSNSSGTQKGFGDIHGQTLGFRLGYSWPN